MTPSWCIEEANLSHAWARAVRPLLGGGPEERGPVAVSITGFSSDGVVHEDGKIRDALDSILPEDAQCRTVASTIFPQSLWNPALPRAALFDRYKQLLKKIGKMKGNHSGLYFQRMTADGRDKNANQLDDVLTEYLARPGVRRSALQVGIFDPKRDQIGSRPRGFPCLQQVSFAPLEEGLSVNAFYASQYAIGRAYGNYLGICGLGQFVAHELKVKLVRVTILTGILQRDYPVNTVRNLQTTIDTQLKGGTP
ncbi:MAG: hypothetical protein U0414_31740 [Polyangiaceae bacterium]